jgi:hypothetical protein
MAADTFRVVPAEVRTVILEDPYEGEASARLVE